jgi:hypothetical protein
MSKMIRQMVAPLVAVLCVTVAVLWARSYRHADFVAVYGTAARLQGAASQAGGLILFHSNLRFEQEKPFHFDCGSVPAEDFDVRGMLFGGPGDAWSFAGLGVAQGDLPLGLGSLPSHYVAAAVPHWAAVALTLVPSVLWVRRTVRRRGRLRRGQCGECGYDLRSTPDRCPECGAAARSRRIGGAAIVACLLAVAAPNVAASEERHVATRTMRELDLSNATLEQAFKRLADVSDVDVVVHWPALEAAGVARSTPVRVHLWEVSLAAALDVVLDLIPAHPAILVWGEEDRVITISTKEGLAGLAEPRVYDVRDLIDRIRKEVAPDPPADDSRTWQEVVDEIVRLIAEIVEPDSWRDAGGSVGSLREMGGRLIITQTPHAMERIEWLLDRLRVEFLKPPPALAAPATLPSDDLVLGATRFYDVRDLLAVIRAQPGDRSADFEASAELVGVIIDHVSPAVWRGEVSGIDVIAGRLVVTQKDEKVHAEVERFLDRLRRQILPAAGATSPSAPTRPSPPAAAPPRSARGSPSAAPPPAR